LVSLGFSLTLYLDWSCTEIVATYHVSTLGKSTVSSYSFYFSAKKTANLTFFTKENHPGDCNTNERLSPVLCSGPYLHSVVDVALCVCIFSKGCMCMHPVSDSHPTHLKILATYQQIKQFEVKERKSL